MAKYQRTVIVLLISLSGVFGQNIQNNEVLLVLGGTSKNAQGNFDTTNKVEILNVNKIPYKCQAPKPFPYSLTNHVGGLDLVNNQLMVCGGAPFPKRCRALDKDTGDWKEMPDTLNDHPFSLAITSPKGKFLIM